MYAGLHTYTDTDIETNGVYSEENMRVCMYEDTVTHTNIKGKIHTYKEKSGDRREYTYICVDVNRIAHIHRFQDQDTRIQI